MIELPTPLYLEMVSHCLAGLPDEACGLLAGHTGSGRVTRCYPTQNIAKSAKHYLVDSREHLRADRDAEKNGWELIGVFHSHTHTDAYPSPTDVEYAPDPDWHYVIVSLRETHPVVRSYRIVRAAIEEEPVVVVASSEGRTG